MSTKPAHIIAPTHSARVWAGLGRADLLSLALLVAAALVMLTHLEQWPPWFDEGWTLKVAETWVEQGHYGIIAADGPRGKSLAAALPTVAATALSFELFGVGLWQGRLPAALLMLGGLALLVALARRLYNPRVAAAALAIVLLVSPEPLNPLTSGLQVLAEPAMIFCLAAAYLALPASLARPWPWMGLFWLCAGLALATKAQPLPFVVVSLLAPAGLALWHGRRREAALLALALAGTLAVMLAFPALQAALLAGRTVVGEAVPGLASTVSLVLDADVRLKTILIAVLGAAPLLAGLAYALGRLLADLPAAVDGPRAITRTALLSLTGSWVAWYMLLSIGWPRYLFPAVVLGAIFAAAMLDELSGGFDPQAIRAQLAPGQGLARRLLIAAAVLLIYALGAQAMATGMARIFSSPPMAMAQAGTVAWLNANIPPDALIETYESELLFQLDRPFHYPPDRYHAEIIRMNQRRPGASTAYDPLAAAPDFIAEGPFARNAGLYTQALATGGYRQVFEQGYYRVYSRERP